MPKTKLIIREGDAVVAGIEVDLEQVIGQLVKELAACGGTVANTQGISGKLLNIDTLVTRVTDGRTLSNATNC